MAREQPSWAAELVTTMPNMPFKKKKASGICLQGLHELQAAPANAHWPSGFRWAPCAQAPTLGLFSIHLSAELPCLPLAGGRDERAKSLDILQSSFFRVLTAPSSESKQTVCTAEERAETPPAALEVKEGGEIPAGCRDNLSQVTPMRPGEAQQSGGERGAGGSSERLSCCKTTLPPSFL